MNSIPDFLLNDCSNLRAIHKIAMQILNSAAAPAAPHDALLNPQPTGNFSGIKMYTLESEIDHEKINTDQLIVSEARSIPTPSPHHQPTLNQDFLEP